MPIASFIKLMFRTQLSTLFVLFYLCALLLGMPYKERTYDRLDLLMTTQLLMCCQVRLCVWALVGLSSLPVFHVTH